MVVSDSDIIKLLSQMRDLIKDEFGIVLPIRTHNAFKIYYYYGAKSKQSNLVNLSQELKKYMNEDSHKNKERSGYNKVEPKNVLSNREEIIVDDIERDHGQVSSHKNQDIENYKIIDSPRDSATSKGGENRFLELLASKQVDKPIQILHPSIDTLIINKSSGMVYSSLKLNELLSMSAEQLDSVQVKEVSQKEIEELASSVSQVKLSIFLWSCGIRISNESMLSDLKKYPAFRFKKWPDFFMLPDHTKVAVAMSKSSYSVDELIESLGINKQLAIGFLNAAYLCGSLDGVEKEPKADETSSPVPSPSGSSRPERRGLISRIRAKLRNLS